MLEYHAVLIWSWRWWCFIGLSFRPLPSCFSWQGLPHSIGLDKWWLTRASSQAPFFSLINYLPVMMGALAMVGILKDENRVGISSSVLVAIITIG